MFTVTKMKNIKILVLLLLVILLLIWLDMPAAKPARTVGEESKFALNGETTQNSWRMLGDGPAKDTQYIASTMTGTTSQATSSGLPQKSKPPTGATRGSKEGGGTHCPVERAAVKLLNDKDAHAVMEGPIQASTIHDLITHAAPTKQELLDATATRFPAEKMKVEVSAMVTGYKKESDLDFHIVLSDPSTGQTMIAEIPSGSCMPIEYAGEFSALQKQFASDFGKPTARYKQVTPEKVKITGIVFFDFLHGQTGVAPNGVELHPVLGWSK